MQNQVAQDSNAKVGKKRNIILAILFITWTVCYMDRMVMTVAVPYIAKDFSLNSIQTGFIMSAFFAGYALFQIPGGMLADKFGARKVMAIAVSWWSVFTAVTGMATSLAHMLIVRFLFGLGEASFPGGSWKTVSTWFPKKERATANSLMLSSNSLGPAIAPLFVVGIMAAFSWRSVFYFLFIPGIVVVALILIFIRDNPADSKMLSQEEKDLIAAKDKDDVTAVKLSFGEVIKMPIVWKIFFTFFAFDIVFWGFSSWIPSYLVAARGFKLVKMGIVASLPFFAGTVGTVVGGWISDKYFVGRRKTVIVVSMIIAAICLLLTYNMANAVLATVFLTCTGFFVCVAFGGIWALPMNLLPPDVMGSSSGFINFAGQCAGFLSPIIMGYLIQFASGSYYMAFGFLVIASILAAAIAFTINEKTAAAAKSASA